MRARRLLALLVFSILLALFLGPNLSAELRARTEILRQLRGLPLSTRRMAGQAARDRRFFEFVEQTRTALPASAQGLALYAPGVTQHDLYLAVYHLAPLPVLIAPERVPPHWVAACYENERPAGWRLLRVFPDGALLAPP